MPYKLLSSLTAILIGFISIGQTSNRFSVSPEYSVTIYGLVSSNLPSSDFYVSEAGQAFVPINGGVYNPKDSTWFIPPKAGRIISSFSANAIDSAIILAYKENDSSTIHYLKANRKLGFDDAILASLDPGFYNVNYKNNTLVIWGRNKGLYRIGYLGRDSLKWVVNIPEKISSVFLDNHGTIYFSAANKIINYNINEVVAQLDTTITGFSFLESRFLVVSTPQGVYTNESGNFKAIATDLDGLIKTYGKDVYILSNRKSLLVKLSKRV